MPRKPDIAVIARMMTDAAIADVDFQLYRRAESVLTDVWLEGVRFGRTGASTAGELKPKKEAAPKVKRSKAG